MRGSGSPEGAPELKVKRRCSTISRGGEEELRVSVDGKRAVHARQLRWNFRGNQTVFVDGAPVDVMWDLHGWWFRDPPGCVVVMLQARRALEEEAAAPGFSLVVQAFKTLPWSRILGEVNAHCFPCSCPLTWKFGGI
ncbi:uncharacterized protein LOC133906800 [Phragmites australis]|uniref:uncharacterized protein LOC133906800 n=1 Tax=Phragmites australis TaxID=29695 RepID=UPI002D798575|nr:uncharacterized protein LOC133906800 [Phragmites australis]